MSAWINDFIKINPYSRPAIKLKEVKKIIAHFTANPGASASNHRKYFGESLIGINEKLPKNKRRYASAHIFVDKIEAICIIPLDEITFAANDEQKFVNGEPYRGVPELLPNANFLSINVELCIEKDGTFHPDTIKRAEEVFAELCKMFNLDPIKDIVRHFDITSKNCPAPWVSNPNEYIDFKNRVKEKMNPIEVAKVEQTIGDEDKLILSDSLKKQMLQALENMSDSTKHGKDALSKDWVTKLQEDKLTVSESIALMYIAKDRGLL